MAGVTEKFRQFEYKGLLVITLIFAIMAGILFLERSGIRQNYAQLSISLLPEDAIVTKQAALDKQEATCLVLWDSASADSRKAAEEFEIILADMKVGHIMVDVSSEPVPAFEDYETAVVLLTDLSAMARSVLPLCDWVYGGGLALFPLTLEKELYFSTIESKLGISESAYGNVVVDSIYIEEGFMLGGGQAYEIPGAYASGLALQLTDSERVRVYARTGDEQGLPLIWEASYGDGKFVVDNIGIYEKSMRGFYAASYSLLEDVCVYPVINGSAFYLDDFPSQIPTGDSSYIQRDYGTSVRDFYVNIWWPDMMSLSDKYGIKFTGLAIECYDDIVDGSTDALPDTGTFLTFGNMLLRKGGEIGYHGYNHQPLCFDNCDYKGVYDYKTWENEWAMKSGLDELMDFCEELFPDVAMQLYVPPSNLLSQEGRELLLREYPHIRTISGIYFAEDELDFVCLQEFEVSQDGVVDQPRIISGCDVNPFMQLAAVSELNFHYINSHFTHPDDALDPDRGAELGWEELSARFDTYLTWLYTAAPNIRNFTGTEMSAAVQRYVALSPSMERDGDRLEITLDGFYDDAQLMLRFNEGVPGHVEGGTLEQLTDTLYLLQAEQAVVTVTLE